MPKHSTYTAKTPDADGHIAYTDKENATWAALYARQAPEVARLSARAYRDGLTRIALPENRVPQCSDVSERLLSLTGWRVTPVPALIPFGTFFEMLSQRCFPAASFIRRPEDFDYIEEPDIFHELFGHTPLLTDPRFANLSQAIGAAGLHATAKDRAWLIRLYWFTIEFGLTREDGAIKALGSGLASSPEELRWSTSGAPCLRPFDVIDILRTPYRIDIPQPIYFVLDDLDNLFDIAKRDLLADVAEAQRLGLHTPMYPPKAA